MTTTETLEERLLDAAPALQRTKAFCHKHSEALLDRNRFSFAGSVVQHCFLCVVEEVERIAEESYDQGYAEGAEHGRETARESYEPLRDESRD